VHFLVAPMAKHDAVADGLSQFREPSKWKDVVHLQLLILKWLSAMWATPPLSLIQLVLVFDAVVFHMVFV